MRQSLRSLAGSTADVEDAGELASGRGVMVDDELEERGTIWRSVCGVIVPLFLSKLPKRLFRGFHVLVFVPCLL